MTIGRLGECCILRARTPGDGVRVSTMSCHTIQDGLTPDSRLVGMYDVWLPELSPGPRLVGAWYRGELSWESFRAKYLDRIHGREASSAAAAVRALLASSDVSLMCIEEDAGRCHRSVLLDHFSGR